MAELTYFAYGSNLLTVRLRDRVPSAAAVGLATLPGFDLTFDKHSNTDGSGKCTIVASTHPATVYGVVFSFPSREKPSLDRAEGLGHGYEVLHVTVNTGDGGRDAFTYIAPDKHRDHRLKPFGWYKALVLAGAEEHALPQAWIHKIRAVETMVDPDPARAADNRSILAKALPGD